ncbi:MAG: RidA family protein [Proteobacteria bacterium]|nr:RidA family protein [Pseudomonadota bacterium]
MSVIAARMIELGIELPGANPPAGNYVPFVRTGNLVHIAGQTCKWNGVMQFEGKLGKELTVEQGQKAARFCLLNILLQLRNACEGDLDKVKRAVRMTVYVNCAADFYQLPQVGNGASDLMIEIFGERGKHVRSAVGAHSLPLNSAVEIDAIFELKE